MELISWFRKNNTILDVGCGEGLFLKLCKDKGWRELGIEVDYVLVQKAQEKYGIKVLCGDFLNMPLPESFFDVVSFFGVLDHLPDPMGALKKSFRILRGGGIVILRQPNIYFHLKCRKFFVILSKFYKKMKKIDPTTIHLFAMDKWSLTKYLIKSGFRIIFIRNSFPKWKFNFSYRRKEIPIDRLIGILIKAIIKIVDKTIGENYLISPSIMAVAIKPD